MPSNRKALAARFPGLGTSQRNQSPESVQPDKPLLEEKSARLPYAEEQFRLCSEKKWSTDAWVDWFDWSRKRSKLRGGNYFESERTIDNRYSVRWSDTESLGETPGALHSNQALAILEEFGLDNIIAGFDEFWETVHACLIFPRLTPAALKRDHEVYGHFNLDERLQKAKIRLRQKGILR